MKTLMRGNRPLAAVLAGTVLLLSLGAGALAAQASNVVPPTGKVAGHGYAYWLERNWQFMFNLNRSSSLSRNPCKSLTANGKRVAFLRGASTAHNTCSEPAGQPIYVPLLSAECSTFSGDHDVFGTSDVQLKVCSRSQIPSPDTTSATVDGHAVNINGFVAATNAFPVHAVSGNVVGVPAGNGRSAAYGYGLLLTGFPKGTHTIQYVVIHQGSRKANITYTVHAS